MITKASFVKIMDKLDEYYNGEIWKALQALGIEENVFTNLLDTITDVMNEEVDPKHLARTDELTMDCGCYVHDWLIGNSEINEKCKTAEERYDYISEKYSIVNSNN
jgi:hypothetical protein